MGTIKQDRGEPWQITAASSPTVTATVTGDSAKTIFLTDVSAGAFTASSSSTISISSGSTVIWQDYFITNYHHYWVQPIQCNPGDALNITVTTTPVGIIVTANASGFKVHLT